MLSWTSTGVGSGSDPFGRWSGLLALFGGPPGVPLGEAMADTARAVIADGDVDDVAGLIEALRRSGADVLAARAFFEALGGRGVADLLMALGSQAGHGDRAVELAVLVRSRLAEDSCRAGFLRTSRRRWCGGSSTSATTGRAARPPPCRSCSTTPRSAPTCWWPRHARSSTRSWPPPPTSPSTAPRCGRRRRCRRCSTAPSTTRANPAGRRSSSVRSTRCTPCSRRSPGTAPPGRGLHRRPDGCVPVRTAKPGLDGMRRLAAAAEQAAAGPDVVTGAHPRLLDDAGLVASAFVNHLGARPVDVLMAYADNADVSRSAATILGQHVLAVQNTVLTGDQDTTGHAASARRRPRRRPGRGPRGRCDPPVRLVRRARPRRRDGPGRRSDRRVGDHPGRAGRARPDQATLAIGRLAAGDLPAGRDANLFLAEAMQDAARLEAHLIAHAGHRAEERGRSVDGSSARGSAWRRSPSAAPTRSTRPMAERRPGSRRPSSVSSSAPPPTWPSGCSPRTRPRPPARPRPTPRRPPTSWSTCGAARRTGRA